MSRRRLGLHEPTQPLPLITATLTPAWRSS